MDGITGALIGPPSWLGENSFHQSNCCSRQVRTPVGFAHSPPPSYPTLLFLLLHLVFRSRLSLLRSLDQHWTTFKTPLASLAQGNLLRRPRSWKSRRKKTTISSKKRRSPLLKLRSLKTMLRGATLRKQKLMLLLLHVVKQRWLQSFKASMSMLYWRRLLIQSDAAMRSSARGDDRKC